MARPEAVKLVSALKGTGVEELLIQLHREVGTNGDVWVVRCPVPRHPELSASMPALAPDIPGMAAGHTAYDCHAMIS